MNKDIIRQVKEAELRAEQKTEEAKGKADSIVREARHHAVETRQEIIETAKKNAKDLFETGAKQFEPELAHLRQTFQHDIEKETAYARQQIETVVDFVVGKFYEQFDNE